MHHRNDENRVGLDVIEEAVRETTNEEATEALGEPMTYLGVSGNRSRSVTHLGYEFQAETCRLGLIKLAGSDELHFGVRMEADAFHRSVDRAFLNTSFAGIPATAPL